MGAQMRGQWEPGESEVYKGFISGPSGFAAAQLFHGTLGFPTATMAEVPVSNHWLHGSNRQSMGRGVYVLLVWIWKPWPTSGGNGGHSNPSVDYNREGVYLDPSIAVSASWFPNCQDGSSPNGLLLYCCSGSHAESSAHSSSHLRILWAPYSLFD